MLASKLWSGIFQFQQILRVKLQVFGTGIPLPGDLLGHPACVRGSSQQTPPCEADCVQIIASFPAVRKGVPWKSIILIEEFSFL